MTETKRRELAGKIAAVLLNDLTLRKGCDVLFTTAQHRAIEEHWTEQIFIRLPDGELHGTSSRDRLPKNYVDGNVHIDKPQGEMIFDEPPPPAPGEEVVEDL